MPIRPFRSSDVPEIQQLITSLHPQWFDENALHSIPRDAQIGTTFVATQQTHFLGFITLASLEGVVWINWMAVAVSHHGQGVGTQLLTHAEEFLKNLGVQELQVNTVVEQSPPDGSYDKTLPFYLKHGFTLLEKQPQQVFEQYVYCRGVLKKNIA